MNRNDTLSFSEEDEEVERDSLYNLFYKVSNGIRRSLLAGPWEDRSVVIVESLDGFLFKLTQWSQDINDAHITLPIAERDAEELSLLIDDLLRGILSK
jgi:hypothetical protein